MIQINTTKLILVIIAMILGLGATFIIRATIDLIKYNRHMALKKRCESVLWKGEYKASN